MKIDVFKGIHTADAIDELKRLEAYDMVCIESILENGSRRGWVDFYNGLSTKDPHALEFYGKLDQASRQNFTTQIVSSLIGKGIVFSLVDIDLPAETTFEEYEPRLAINDTSYIEKILDGGNRYRLIREYVSAVDDETKDRDRLVAEQVREDLDSARVKQRIESVGEENFKIALIVGYFHQTGKALEEAGVIDQPADEYLYDEAAVKQVEESFLAQLILKQFRGEPLTESDIDKYILSILAMPTNLTKGVPTAREIANEGSSNEDYRSLKEYHFSVYHDLKDLHETALRERVDQLLVDLANTDV